MSVAIPTQLIFVFTALQVGSAIFTDSTCPVEGQEKASSTRCHVSSVVVFLSPSHSIFSSLFSFATRVNLRLLGTPSFLPSFGLATIPGQLQPSAITLANDLQTIEATTISTLFSTFHLQHSMVSVSKSFAVLVCISGIESCTPQSRLQYEHMILILRFKLRPHTYVPPDISILSLPRTHRELNRLQVAIMSGIASNMLKHQGNLSSPNHPTSTTPIVNESLCIFNTTGGLLSPSLTPVPLTPVSDAQRIHQSIERENVQHSIEDEDMHRASSLMRQVQISSNFDLAPFHPEIPYLSPSESMEKGGRCETAWGIYLDQSSRYPQACVPKSSVPTVTAFSRT